MRFQLEISENPSKSAHSTVFREIMFKTVTNFCYSATVRKGSLYASEEHNSTHLGWDLTCLPCRKTWTQFLAPQTAKNMPENKQKITTHMRVLFLKKVIIQITFKGNTVIM